MLTRRTGTDAAFIRTLWNDRDFVQRFHRQAAEIPQRQEDLERILNSEYAALISDLNSIHWVVRDGRREPWGVLSLVNVSLAHRRAEVLLGVKDDSPFGLATAAMLLLFRFYFSELKFKKLCSLTFDDNLHSRRSTLHLGFKEEGRFREHFYDAAANRFIDMVQAGLLAEDAFSASNERLMRRLNPTRTEKNQGARL